MAEDISKGYLQMPALGRQFKLGMLYDCRTEKVIDSSCLWDKGTLVNFSYNLPQENSDSNIISPDNLHSKANALDLNDSLTVSFMSGLLDICGSSRYIFDRMHSSYQERVTIHFKSTTHFEGLRMDELTENKSHNLDLVASGIATHVVTGIMYGGQRFLVFDKSNTDAQPDTNNKSLQFIINKIQLNQKLKIETDYPQDIIDSLHSVQVKIFSDLMEPVSYTEALPILNSLPEFFGENRENAKPITVWLYPLCKLDRRAPTCAYSVSSSDMRSIVDILEGLHEFHVSCKDTMAYDACKQLPERYDEIKCMDQVLRNYKIEFRRELYHIVPKIRAGKTNPSELEAIINRHQDSPFRDDNIAAWLWEEHRMIGISHSDSWESKSVDVTQTLESLESYVNSLEQRNKEMAQRTKPQQKEVERDRNISEFPQAFLTMQGLSIEEGKNQADPAPKLQEKEYKGSAFACYSSKKVVSQYHAESLTQQTDQKTFTHKMNKPPKTLPKPRLPVPTRTNPVKIESQKPLSSNLDGRQTLVYQSSAQKTIQTTNLYQEHDSQEPHISDRATVVNRYESSRQKYEHIDFATGRGQVRRNASYQKTVASEWEEHPTLQREQAGQSYHIPFRGKMPGKEYNKQQMDDQKSTEPCQKETYYPKKMQFAFPGNVRESEPVHQLESRKKLFEKEQTNVPTVATKPFLQPQKAIPKTLQTVQPGMYEHVSQQNRQSEPGRHSEQGRFQSFHQNINMPFLQSQISEQARNPLSIVKEDPPDVQFHGGENILVQDESGQFYYCYQQPTNVTHQGFPFPSQKQYHSIVPYQVMPYEGMHHNMQNFPVSSEEPCELSTQGYQNHWKKMKPETPEVSNVTHNSVTLKWKKPDIGQEKVYEYEVTWREINGLEESAKTGYNCETFVVSNLKPGKQYTFQVRACGDSTLSNYSEPCDPVQTLPTNAPGKVKFGKVFLSKLTLNWSKPTVIGEKVTVDSYVIYALTDDNGDDNWLELATVPGIRISTEVHIKVNTTYRFKVVADCQVHGRSELSQESDPFCHKVSGPDLIRAQAKIMVDMIKPGSPSIYQIKMKEIFVNVSENIRKCEIGNATTSGVQEKVIMVVGATGSGKSTLINGMLNYLLGIDWKDDYRVKLIVESTEDNQAKSQTSGITSYTIHHQSSFLIPYTLTIIDTPGFGDTEGITRDKKITDQIRHFFSTKAPEGIDHLDAVGFVVQASLPRLTTTQRYIFDSILALFGKDISGNIFMLVTFADGQLPSVLSGLKEARLPYEHYFKFNNSALFAKNESITSDENFTELFWKMGSNSFKSFFTALNEVPTKTLVLTKDVLNERRQLETYIQGIQFDIQLGLNKLEQLQTEEQVLKTHQRDVDKNKDFEYTVEEDSVILTAIPPGTYTTNCVECKRTCHYPCAFKENADKIRCAAMKDGFCEVCDGPQKCPWDLHRNLPHKYEIKREKKKKTAMDLKKRYEDAQGKKLTAVQLIDKVLDEFDEIQLKVIKLTESARLTLKRLQEIALKPNPLSTPEYIDIMIKSEEIEGQPGWLKRVEQLKKVRKEAEWMQKVANEGFDPFQKYKEKVAGAKKVRSEKLAKGSELSKPSMMDKVFGKRKY